MRRRLALVSARMVNEPLIGLLLNLVSVFVLVTGIDVAQICVTLLGLRPSVAPAAGKVPSALKFSGVVKTIDAGASDAL